MKPTKREEAPRAPVREFNDSVEGDEGGGGSYGHPRPPEQDEEEVVGFDVDADEED